MRRVLRTHSQESDDCDQPARPVSEERDVLQHWEDPGAEGVDEDEDADKAVNCKLCRLYVLSNPIETADSCKYTHPSITSVACQLENAKLGRYTWITASRSVAVI